MKGVLFGGYCLDAVPAAMRNGNLTEYGRRLSRAATQAHKLVAAGKIKPWEAIEVLTRPRGAS